MRNIFVKYGEDFIVDEEERQSLESQLRTHRQNLRYLRAQAAKYNIDLPLELHNRIVYEEEKIAHIENLLEYDTSWKRRRGKYVFFTVIILILVYIASFFIINQFDNIYMSQSSMMQAYPTSITNQIPTVTKLPDVIQLTTGVGNNYSPSFSPIEDRIIFISTRDGNAEVYIMNFDGTDQQRLTYTNNIQEDLPSFSPEGSKIIFSGNDGNNDDIYSMNVDGSEYRNLSDTPSINEGRPRIIRNQFVSQELLFDSDRTGVWQVYRAILDVNGIKNATQITHTAKNSRLPSYIDNIEQVVFRFDEEEPSGRVVSHIGTIDLNGNNFRRLSIYNDWYPNTSFDGQFILFISDRSGEQKVYAYNTKTENTKPLSNIASGDATPTVSSDNKWAIVASKRNSNNLQLYRIPFKLLPP